MNHAQEQHWWVYFNWYYGTCVPGEDWGNYPAGRCPGLWGGGMDGGKLSKNKPTVSDDTIPTIDK